MYSVLISGKAQRAPTIYKRYSSSCLPNSHLREGEFSGRSPASVSYGKQTAKPELMGASVFGHNEIYTQLKAYRSRLISASPSGCL